MKQERKELRLLNYDYSSPGAYFVTIVTHNRKDLFCKIIDQNILLTQTGLVAQYELKNLELLSTQIHINVFVIMPDHIHVVIEIFEPTVGVTQQAHLFNLSDNGSMPSNTMYCHSGSPTKSKISLGSVIGQYKSRVTKRLKRMNHGIQEPLWQRGYYEHIIRDEFDYERIAAYIQNNPQMDEDD